MTLQLTPEPEVLSPALSVDAYEGAVLSTPHSTSHNPPRPTDRATSRAATAAATDAPTATDAAGTPGRSVPAWLQGRPIGSIEQHVRDERTAELLLEASETADPGRRRECLEEVVLLNGGVAEALASRYRSRGVESDDLVQVAYLGLVKAAHGYRVGEGPGFLAYAVPTISGEIKRHFRDFGWLVRPPRRIQELRASVTTARADLQQMHGRPPTEAELAEFLGVECDELSEAVMADGCFTGTSLDAPVDMTGGQTLSLAECLAADEEDFEHVEMAEVLRPALAGLSERDRRILTMRFVSGASQQQIGAKIGVSQMQVSRLLTRILGELRSAVGDVEESALSSVC